MYLYICLTNFLANFKDRRLPEVAHSMENMWQYINQVILEMKYENIKQTELQYIILSKYSSLAGTI